MQLLEMPFPHAIIDDFLDDDLFVELCEVLETLELERKESDLFQFDQSGDLTGTDNPVLKKLQEKLLALKDYLSKNFQTRVEKLDMFSAFYYDTDYLLPHDDQLETRKVAYTFYIATPEQGGDLSLIEHAPPHKKTSIHVVPNRLVLFPVSQHSWHEVEEVHGDLPRISISGWFH